MLEDATQGGARAVRQQATLGSLEVGKKADLIVLDTQRVHLVPAGRIVSAWIHNGQASDIESSMVDGRFVMRDRKVLTMDEEAIVAEADKVGRRVWTQVLKGGRSRCRAGRAGSSGARRRRGHAWRMRAISPASRAVRGTNRSIPTCSCSACAPSPMAPSPSRVGTPRPR